MQVAIVHPEGYGGVLRASDGRAFVIGNNQLVEVDPNQCYWPKQTCQALYIKTHNAIYGNPDLNDHIDQYTYGIIPQIGLCLAMLMIALPFFLAAAAILATITYAVEKAIDCMLQWRILPVNNKNSEKARINSA